MFRILLVLVAAVGLTAGGAFVAGTAYGKRSAAHPAQAAQMHSGTTAPDQMVRISPGSAPGAPGAGGPASIPGAFGTVSRVDGRTVYVSAPDGRETKVTLTDSTRIEKQAEGTPSDLKPGTQVAVTGEGQRAADGTLTAAQVVIVPENAIRFEGGAPPGATPAPAGAPGSAGAVQPRPPGR